MRRGTDAPPVLPRGVWIALIAVLAIWVAVRLGALSLWADVSGPNGTVRLPNGFAGVDHPFHAARAASLLAALRDGHPLRWVGHHQGGYPVEFYPLGVAWLEAGVSALALGALPVVAVHKLTVILVFLAPGVAFALLARRDRWPLGVALVASAGHVAVPGDWWHGGYTELVQWGLVTNVAAATATLFVLAWLVDYLDRGSHRAAAGAALAAAFAIATNPRSLLALAVVGVAAWLALALRPRCGQAWPVVVTGRLALVSAAAALLAAPELVSLLRFSSLYAFVRYEAYADTGEYLASAIAAVGGPLFALAVGGCLLAWLLPGRPAARAAAVALFLYGAGTVLFTTRPALAALVPQLEATRLMPFQRFLTLYLAACAVGAVADWLWRREARVGRQPRPRLTWVGDGLLMAVAVAILVGYVAPADAAPPVPAVDRPRRGLYPVATSAEPAQDALRAAVEAADRAAAPGTAVLVLGSALSWHQQLWAPLWTARPLFYDDWLWYWQADHAGPPGYDFAAGHAYPEPALALEPAYFERHGIGAVVATGESEAAAARSPDLRPLPDDGGGAYAAFSVRRPTAIVTVEGGAAVVREMGEQRIVVDLEASAEGAPAVIRRNWYPRWRASIDGQPVALGRAADGYMEAEVPAGGGRMVLSYGVDRLDWLARMLAVVGGVVVAGLLLGGRRWGSRLGGARDQAFEQ